MKRFIRKWQRRFGLVCWEIFVKASDKDDNRAWVKIDVSGRIATVFYSHSWWSHATAEEKERVAFHEMMEVLLFPLMDDLGRYYSDVHLASRAHEIIRVFENIQFGTDKGVTEC